MNSLSKIISSHCAAACVQIYVTFLIKHSVLICNCFNYSLQYFISFAKLSGGLCKEQQFAFQ